MDSIYLVGLVILGGIGFLFFRQRRQRRLTLTEQTVRCPAYDEEATLAVRTDPLGCPARRHVGVATCSLLPSAPYVPPAQTAYLADMVAAGTYPYEVDTTPRHAVEVRCPKLCLPLLNAGESGPQAEPIRCSSGMADSLELARQTQSPAIMRLLWYHSN
jgi:hypothetical protein